VAIINQINELKRKKNMKIKMKNMKKRMKKINNKKKVRKMKTISIY
jgi:hypothetical protein